MSKPAGYKQDRERAMDGDELREAYMKIFFKYGLKGVWMRDPGSLPFFAEKKTKRRVRQVAFTAATKK